MKNIWLTFLYLCAIGFLLFLAVMGIGWYAHSSKETARKKSAFFQQLERTDRENGDIIKLLLEGISGVSNADAKIVENWLEERQLRGDQPYLYLIGSYHGVQKEKRQKKTGIKWLAKGSLVYRIDAAKCGDPSATQAVPILEEALAVNLVRQNLKNYPEFREEVIKSALEYEEQNKDRQLPKWICSHGMSQGSLPPGNDAWSAHRQTIRAQFEKSF